MTLIFVRVGLRVIAHRRLKIWKSRT